MSVSAFPFGALSTGEVVTAYRIEASLGASVTLIDYGAAVQSLLVPDARGGLTDVVLGYDSAAEYQRNNGHLGATIGRHGNRIGGAAFSLGGKVYPLAANNGPNHLHGGTRGFDKYLWQADCGEDFVRFSRLSPDGEENYPGDLAVCVTYTLTGDNTLRIVYDADTSADTVVNLTNHSYFNLAGGGSALDTELLIHAERFTELGEGTLPTGRILPVEGTPLDFRRFKPIGRDIGADCEQLRLGGGYDHNFVLSGRHAACARSAASGIQMDVYTDMPGVQLYSANGLSARPGKGGKVMAEHFAFCLETQLFPNAMNCYGFPSPVLRAGCHLHSETDYAFSVIAGTT